MPPGVQIGCRTVDLSVAKLGQARPQASSQVQVSSIYLHSGTQAEAAIV